jgi:RNA polymerase sigma-70 factor, ECF subfamily
VNHNGHHRWQTSQEASLVERVQRGEEAAFLEIYRRCQGMVYRYALRMTGAADAADDVTQEVFLGLIRGIGDFDAGRGTLASYLFGAARRQVFRRLGASSELPLDEESAELIPAGGVHPLDGLERKEQLALLRQALAALPPHYREAVVLCDLEEMSYADAAGMLGCAVGTVRSRLNRARAQLMERMNAVRFVS